MNPKDLDKMALLRKMFLGEAIAPLISPDSLVPPATLQNLEIFISSLSLKESEISVLQSRLNWRIKTPHMSVKARIALDDLCRITNLQIHSPLSTKRNFEDLLHDLSFELPLAGVQINKNGIPIFSLNENRKYHVASLFKLWIMKEYQSLRHVDRNKLLRLGDFENSLETGILQNMPQDTILTLDQLVMVMCIHSDNTAADILMEYLGRDTFDKYHDDFPLISTREWMIINNSLDMRKSWKYASLDERIKILSFIRLNRMQPAEIDVWPEVGWQSTPRQMCDVLGHIQSPYLSVGYPQVIFDVARFINFNYKGGHAPGVSATALSLFTVSNNRYDMVFIYNDSSGFNSPEYAEKVAALSSFIRRLTIPLEEM